MGKRDAHKQDLCRLFDEFEANGDAERLIAYLVPNSNLPGPRGNLELAQAFGDVVGERAGEGQLPEPLWALCDGLTGITATEAPVNDPREFLPFCGAVGLGAIGAATARYCQPALGALRVLASDPRWRMRESVRMGLQRLMDVRRDEVLPALKTWVAAGRPLEMRAVAAGIAEPSLLVDRITATVALDLHRGIFDQLLALDDRRSDAFRALRRGLGYTLSIIVCALPREGFAYLAELAGVQDRDVQWILKQNLKKSRLIKNYPDKVDALMASL